MDIGVANSCGRAVVQSPTTQRIAAMHAGRYRVRCYGMQDVVKDLDRFAPHWRSQYDSPLKAALQLGALTRDDLPSLLKWTDYVDNLLVDTGRDEYLTQLWKASAYTAQHYLGFVDGPTPSFAAGDTMVTHAGWTEFTEYAAATRPDLTANLGAVAAASLTTSTSISITVNADTLDCNGLFTTTNNVKGGTTGTLITAGTFTQGNKSVDTNDVLDADITFTMASA